MVKYFVATILLLKDQKKRKFVEEVEIKDKLALLKVIA